jgi:transcriptional regulator with XRE-family HTH domain
MSGLSKKRIKSLLKRPGVNLSGLSLEIGIPYNTLRSYAAMKRKPTAENLFLISQHFEKPMESFFDKI